MLILFHRGMYPNLLFPFSLKNIVNYVCITLELYQTMVHVSDTGLPTPTEPNIPQRPQTTQTHTPDKPTQTHTDPTGILKAFDSTWWLA